MTAPAPSYPHSIFIKNVIFDRFRCHRGDGDMWPITWADDDNLHGAAGDNSGSPMNLWHIQNGPQEWSGDTGWGVWVEFIDPKQINPKIYCQRPDVQPKMGIKPASLTMLMVSSGSLDDYKLTLQKVTLVLQDQQNQEN